MRYKFFPGSELSPPFLLGGIVDLDRPQHVVANVLISDEQKITISPIVDLDQDALSELEDFAQGITLDNYRRVAVDDIMFYTSRRRAMC